MKKALIIISIILIVGLAVWFFGFYLPKKKKNDTEETLKQVSQAAELPAGSFPLKPGDKNKKVLLIQKILNLRFKAGLVEDGVYGPKTQEAVAKFITADKLGPTVFNAVQIVLNGGAPSTDQQILDLFKNL